MKTVALIVAAGRGTRAVGADNDVLPKQYHNIGGAPVIRHTLHVFSNHPDIDAVLPVIHRDDDELFRESSSGLEKILPPVYGGATRQDSVRAGLEALATNGPENVLIHDGARPFVTEDSISNVINKLAHEVAVLPAVRVADTLRRGRGGIAREAVDRTDLYAAQTPQGFRFPAILAAHRRAATNSDQRFTDDASIARWAGITVAMVDGDAANIKITRPEDFDIADSRLRGSMIFDPGAIRTGQGYDVHAFGPGDAVILCGVKIPYGQALKGHSDADAGLHAITDAILGAIGAGDIGLHFPPGDRRWKNADSATFLAHAADLVTSRGGRISHIDVTLICEAPKIGPHRDAMRTRIAEILNIEPDRVSVKATTTEKLGFTGRAEGIAAQAIATVYAP